MPSAGQIAIYLKHAISRIKKYEKDLAASKKRKVDLEAQLKKAKSAAPKKAAPKKRAAKKAPAKKK